MVIKIPVLSYNISGIVKDSSGNAVSGATVTCFNTNTKEWLKASAISTTNTSGEYAIDLFNFDNGYSNLDEIQITAKSDISLGTAMHTIDVIDNFHTVNIYLTTRGTDFNQQFSIGNLVDQVGCNISISSVTRTVNTRGDPTETETKYISRGVVDVVDGSEELVKEGLLENGDIVVYIDSSAPAVDKIEHEGYIYYDGDKYIIKEKENEGNHIRLLCKKY